MRKNLRVSKGQENKRMSVLNVPKTTFMDVDDVNIFEQSVTRFFEQYASPTETRRWRDQGSVDRDLWRKAGELGLLGVSIPEAYGGAGGDFRHEVVIMLELGRRSAAGFAIPLHNAVVAPYIYNYATEEQKHRWLPGAVSGETVLAVAMTEPAAGSDLQGMKTVAVRDGDHYRISGQKTFISNGLHASLIVVAAKTDPTAGGKGISLFVVETDKVEGFERGRLLDKMGQESRDTAELFFNDVKVPAENMLGQEGGGFAMLMENLPQERMVIAWQAMAMIEAALDQTVDYVKERRAFSKRLLDFQNTQFKLAECVTKATAARVFLDNCTERLLSNALDAATASMAKLFVTETQAQIVDECLQLHGGYGYMSEYPIADMYKDARGFRIYGGTSEIMKLIIARSL
jgi:acyl-CoA dehydrogenase